MLKMINYGDVIEFKASRTIFGCPLYLTHFFYIDGLLIDTGPQNIAAEVRNIIRQLAVKQVVITHQHEDHTGNISFFEQELGIPVFAHPETIRVVKQPPKIQIYRHLMWGAPPPAKPLPVGTRVDTDKFSLKVIHTPGHSIDHTSYFEPVNRWLFCGDLFLGENLTGFMSGENIAEHFVSLKKVILLNPEYLFCGLKGRIENATSRLLRKYRQWWSIGMKVKKLYQSGASHQKIIRDVFGREILFFYFSQSNWGRRYMLETIIDNLDIFNNDPKNPYNLQEFYS
jgi:glyoxylase-like metal-dependent hydrolase (beta-lactamase superfamily II)